ncbi:hypothetical protein BRE01_59850 [Brevibacillus reuszeri]|uniref:Uncharacterized protein n=1 Tax=Brevibacillus reuszeri TaxID=54915 RepID=A0A0K9YNM9_9BACL|nr:hypothetical protein [Brevibacillus reuszeri]KNB70262.1 hypothetical protein ADS79_14955 [Brevibacillus reuszeri]MED1859221.1 hypothetical protein [Brevibacillus reuszeri]GED72283.1 hypothetical protein BRE01_59850 [Brevibacillus reuszeri]
MEVLDALEGLGSIIKKGATLTIRVLAGSGELLVSLFEYFWNRKEKDRFRKWKTPAGPQGRQG